MRVIFLPKSKVASNPLSDYYVPAQNIDYWYSSGPESTVVLKSGGAIRTSLDSQSLQLTYNKTVEAAERGVS